MRGNRTGKGWFQPGRSGNLAGRPIKPCGYVSEESAERRVIASLTIEARKFSGLAIDTLVELLKDTHTDSTRFNAASALLDRGFGRPAQSLDLHLSADAIQRRLSDMTDVELAALEARMIAAAPLALEADAADGPGDAAAEDGATNGSGA